MASMRRALLLLLALLVQLHTAILLSSAHHAHGDNVTADHLPIPFLCRPDQAKQLLELKKSFSFGYSTTTLSSWRDGTDCCLWEGVGCDASSGNVTILDLHNRGLVSYGLDPAVFSLTSLRRLDLSMNDFSGAAVDDGDFSMNEFSGDPFNEGIHWLGVNIPATGFERFTLLTHLNLSYLGLRGPIPAGIGKLVNLLSLDLSSSIATDGYNADLSNHLWVPSFDTLVANLSKLRELYLDGLDLSSSGEDWCTTLATYVPHLQILSMVDCALTGPVCKSLSGLRSLVVLNLQNNYNIAGPFPGFLMDFLNLTMLQLSNANLQGWFPSRPFQSKNLRVLDLSGNLYLTGHVPNFSNASSLESLMLHRTSLLPNQVKPTSITNFMSLKELGLDGNLVSVDFLSSFGTLESLCKLDLTFDKVSELGPVFSWIGHHKNLTSLVLSGNFSEITPTLVSNFKALRSLSMRDCTLPRHVLHAVGNLIVLQTLELFYCDLTWGSTMPSSIGNLTNLRNMNIHECGFLGPIPATIGRLKNLRNMYVVLGGFSGPIPATIGNLTNLESLYIEGEFSGPIPATIGKLTNLRTMYIGIMNNSMLSGPMPDTIGNLTHLNTMGIFGQFYGSSIPYTIGQLSQLVRLNIAGSNFSESIPSSMANLTQLTELMLHDNSLNGEIPSSIFSLPVLRYLDLSNNQLFGYVQDFDTTPSQLERLYLNNNALSGFIPKSFFQLTRLVALDISSNNFMGSLDLTQFWRLRELTLLDLSNNQLHVIDADDDNLVDTSYLSGLQYTRLASCNITRFPCFLRQVKSISYLDLSCNKISGNVPNWLWDNIWSVGPSSYYVNLSHNMFTGFQLINSDILPFNRTVEVLDLSFNNFSGRVPMPSSSGNILEYSNNMFSSLLPNWTLYLRHTYYFRISKNNINDHVPPSICDGQLDILDMSYNNFYGPIPSCLIENVSLTILNLRGNEFNGTLPTNITRCALQTIDLHGNKIEGRLPRGLSNCFGLEALDIGSNRIADTFPSWLRRLPYLSILLLRSNQLYGTIGDNNIVGDAKSTGEFFPSLQIVDLSLNNFSGVLMPQWLKRLKSMMTEYNSSGETILFDWTTITTEPIYHYSIGFTYKGKFMTFERVLTTITVIDFSSNRLEGTIPEAFGSLVSLRVLNLSHNTFTGKIPAQLGSITDLEQLDLSYNQLSGEIPQELTDLTFLDILNLSNNDLVGRIPQSHQFSTFGSSSFGGNPRLCGPPLSELPCGASPYTPSSQLVHRLSPHSVDVVLFLFTGLGFGVGFAAAIVVKWNRVGRWIIKTARALRG